jgi:LAS superfamily LD-carboxypeptidase LdcB
MKPHILTSHKKLYLYIPLGIISLSGLAYASFFSYSTHTTLQKTKTEFTSSTQSFEARIVDLENQLTSAKLENESISQFLSEEQKKIVALERLKRRNEQKIDTLEKLTTIDPELLKKYSKVFFLSENYTPPSTLPIDEEYKIKPDKDLEILEDVYPFLHNLLEDAHEDGIDLRVISAYRSFETQMQLKSTYVTTYGSGANQFSADQGYSEHQLGTTVDFGTPEVPGAYNSFENTTAFTWLIDNAHKYGFILSYPKGNAYYQYEPWHWRFVGQDLARDLKKEGKDFYEMDQREIDEYLIDIFE